VADAPPKRLFSVRGLPWDRVPMSARWLVDAIDGMMVLGVSQKAGEPMQTTWALYRGGVGVGMVTVEGDWEP
jgi:hypothetical protein